MGAGGEMLGNAEGIGFKMAATDAQRGSVAKNKNVWTRMRLAAPMAFGRDIFGGGFDGSGRLPLAELLLKRTIDIRLWGGRGIFAPEVEKGYASVFSALYSGPIGERAAMGAGGLIDGSSHNAQNSTAK
jgi:hypothetical protein